MVNIPCENNGMHIPQCQSESCDLRSLAVTSNGEYAPSGFDGFNNVVVDVPMPSGSISISANGTYDVSSFANAVVDVQGGASDDNFLIAACEKPGSIYSPAASAVAEYAFWSNTYVKGIELPNARHIGSSAFYQCTSLSFASFANCSYIDEYAFLFAGIETIYIPSCEYIGRLAFNGCYKLSSVSIPVCSSISSSAFYGCASLQNVYAPSVQTIRKDAFRECTALSEVICPMVSIIESTTFYNCRALQTISLPNCTVVGASAFQLCTSLQSVSLPVCSVLGTYAFYACFSLQMVSLPNCTAIGTNAFTKCSALESIYLEGSEMCKLYDWQVFQGTPIEDSSYLGHYGSVFVPASLVDTYKSANWWSGYSDRITAL